MNKYDMMVLVGMILCIQASFLVLFYIVNQELQEMNMMFYELTTFTVGIFLICIGLDRSLTC